MIYAFIFLMIFWVLASIGPRPRDIGLQIPSLMKWASVPASFLFILYVIVSGA